MLDNNCFNCNLKKLIKQHILRVSLAAQKDFFDMNVVLAHRRALMQIYIKAESDMCALGRDVKKDNFKNIVYRQNLGETVESLGESRN